MDFIRDCGRQCYFGRLLVRVQGCREFSKTVLDPAIEDTSIPSFVKRGFEKKLGGFRPRRPDVAAEGGELGYVWRFALGLYLCAASLDNWVDEDKGCEESWVEQRNVDKVVPSHAMAYAENWTRHLIALQVYEMCQISRVVKPTWIIAKEVLIEHTASSLVGDVGDPYRPDAEAVLLLGGCEEVFPERFVEFFWKAVGVGGYYGYVARAGIGVVDRDVLFYGEVECVFLVVCEGTRKFADVGTGNFVFYYPVV